MARGEEEETPAWVEVWIRSQDKTAVVIQLRLNDI